jgi:hypothetical protein
MPPWTIGQCPLKLAVYRNWFGKVQEVKKIPLGLKLARLIGRIGAGEGRALQDSSFLKPSMRGNVELANGACKRDTSGA